MKSTAQTPLPYYIVNYTPMQTVCQGKKCIFLAKKCIEMRIDTAHVLGEMHILCLKIVFFRYATCFGEKI